MVSMNGMLSCLFVGKCNISIPCAFTCFDTMKLRMNTPPLTLVGCLESTSDDLFFAPSSRIFNLLQFRPPHMFPPYSC